MAGVLAVLPLPVCEAMGLGLPVAWVALVGILFIAALVTTPFLAALTARKNTPEHFGDVWEAPIGFVATAFLTALTIPILGEWTAARLQRSSDPLVRAIARFEEEHGHPPGDLVALVPHYLNEIPRPAVSGDARFEYAALGERWYLSVCLRFERRGYGGSWEVPLCD